MASVRQQKLFIAENSYLLSLQCRLAILEAVLRAGRRDCIITSCDNEPTIDLDLLGIRDPAALRAVYDIAYARREMLDRPAR